MSEEIVLKEVEVQKLRLRPGDILVFTLPEDTKHSWMNKFMVHLRRILPRTPALIVSKHVKIAVMSAEEAAAIEVTPKENSDERKG